jgi:alditol oxidase
VEEVRSIVTGCRKLTAIGQGHSFNGIADNKDDQISLEHLDRIELDRDSGTVRVGAGVTYGRLAQYLDRRGYALNNLASLPHISVAGAVATATHGSGDTNGNLATAVSTMEIVTAEGDIVSISREHDGEYFQAAVVGLGGFGIVTSLTLDVEPAFSMSQVVYENLPFAQLGSHLDDILSSGYSVSLFLTWQKHEIAKAWIKRRLEPGAVGKLEPEFFGARLAAVNHHPVPGCPADNCTQQMGVPGPWHERLLHFRVDHAPSSGAELQSEYFVPRERAYEAVLAVERLADAISPLLQISEVRSIDADSFWLSPCYKRKSIGIHFTWKPDEPSVCKLLSALEEQLAPFDARPHWGKLFTVSCVQLRALYENLDDWARLRARHDPAGKFINEFLETRLGIATEAAKATE